MKKHVSNWFYIIHTITMFKLWNSYAIDYVMQYKGMVQNKVKKQLKKKNVIRNEEGNSKIPRPYFPSHLYSHVSVLISRLLIATTLLIRASTGRRGEDGGDNTTTSAGIALKCARNARARTQRRKKTTTKATEAAIMKGVNHSNPDSTSDNVPRSG